MSGPAAGGRRRLGFFGRLGSGNYGNDGSFEVLLDVVRRAHPEVDVDAMCSGPDVVRERYGVPARSMHWDDGGAARPAWRVAGLAVTATRVATGVAVDAWRTARWVARHDAVVVPGMGTFESTLPVRPWQVPWALFSLAVSGRLLGVPVAFVDVGVSPVPERANRILLAGALRAAAHRSYRDEYSRDAATALGVDSAGSEVLPDLAMAIAPPGDVPVREVGMGVIAWNGATRAAGGAALQAHYEETVVAAVRRLASDGWAVRLLAGDEEDADVARRVLEAATGGIPGAPSDRAPVRFEPVETLPEVVAAASRLAVVVGARYHTVVAGLVARRPVAAVAYSDKHRVLLEHVGLGEHVHPIATLDADRLVRSVQSLAADADGVTASLSAVLDADRDHLLSRLEAIVGSLVGSTERDPAEARG